MVDLVHPLTPESRESERRFRSVHPSYINPPIFHFKFFHFLMTIKFQK